MEVEERLEKFEATVENTNTKVGMLHTYFLNSYKTLDFLTLLMRMMSLDDISDVKITFVTPGLIMNLGSTDIPMIVEGPFNVLVSH